MKCFGALYRHALWSAIATDALNDKRARTFARLISYESHNYVRVCDCALHTLLHAEFQARTHTQTTFLSGYLPYLLRMRCIKLHKYWRDFQNHAFCNSCKVFKTEVVNCKSVVNKMANTRTPKHLAFVAVCCGCVGAIRVVRAAALIQYFVIMLELQASFYQ